jgi:serine/threonine-protein kinase
MSINKHRFEIIKSIFDELTDLNSDEKEKAINDRCGNDEDLKCELLSLLKSYENADDFLEPKLKEVNSKTKSARDNFIGKHIGHYLVEGEAGIGGMGIVYAGRRDDKEFEQKVAIKLLRQGLGSDYLLQRFQRERQTLANLQHPNIARLLDGGSTEDGFSYLVMEFIDGNPITDYCDSKELTIRERLELFRTVCSAVQYAHQSLVVHRDIKPANILVNKQGRPKLLDFGIAKLLDEDIGEAGNELTKAGIWHFTPEYASPEQMKSESITTTSDIYSLGVLLYQLLSGHHPYRITSSSPLAVSKIITEEKIVKPSDKFHRIEEVTAADGNAKQLTPEIISKTRSEKPEKIFRNLRGDLDNIVLKAMHKDPFRRYASAEQFSEDIKRFLTGLPVMARKDTVQYRVSKFVQRHRVGVVLSGLILMLLISSIIIISWQANIASEERDNARIESNKFERVNMFLQGMLSSVDPNELGRDVKVYDILEKAAEDIKTELKDQPEIEADISRTLGNTYVSLGEYDEAEPHLYKSLSINENLYGAESKQVAQSLHDIGLFYHWLGDYNLADSLYSVSLIMYRKVLKEPVLPLAVDLNDYAILLTDLGDYDKSEKYLREALSISENISGGQSRDVASMMNNLALTLHYKNNLMEAEKYYLKSQKLFIELFGENHPEVGSTFNNLAFVYMDKDNYKKAEEYFYKSYEIKISLKGEDHPDVGLALNNLGAINFHIGDYETAKDYLHQAIKQHQKTLPEDHAWLALSHFWLGKVYLETNEFSDAEKNLRKSLSIREKVFPPEHNSISVTKGELGISLVKQSNYSEAEKYLVEGYKKSYKNLGESDENTIRFIEHLIILYEKTGNERLADMYKSIYSNKNQ